MSDDDSAGRRSDDDAEGQRSDGDSDGRRPDGDPERRRSDGGATEPGSAVSERITARERVRNRLGGVVSPEDLNAVDASVWLLYLIAMAFFVFPVLWVVSVSLRPPGELFSYPFRLVPPEVSTVAYRRVFREGMVLWLLNSTVVTLASVGGIVAVATPAAYAFSRFEFRGRRKLLGLVLLFQMISPVIIIVPLYSVMATLGLVRSRIGLILLYVGIQTPFSIWLLKGYFDTVPVELDYAARIDGCDRLQTLRYVLLRPIAPGIAVVCIFNTVLTWSEFVLAYTVIGTESDLYTISIGIYNFQSQFGSDWRAIAAASVVGMLPLISVFLLLQRYFVKGLVEGSFKGQ